MKEENRDVGVITILPEADLLSAWALVFMRLEVLLVKQRRDKRNYSSGVKQNRHGIFPKLASVSLESEPWVQDFVGEFVETTVTCPFLLADYVH